MHDDMLLREVDAFVGKDYRQAHDLAYTTYQECSALSGDLSNAFGVTVGVPAAGGRRADRTWWDGRRPWSGADMVDRRRTAARLGRVRAAARPDAERLLNIGRRWRGGAAGGGYAGAARRRGLVPVQPHPPGRATSGAGPDPEGRRRLSGWNGLGRAADGTMDCPATPATPGGTRAARAPASPVRPSSSATWTGTTVQPCSSTWTSCGRATRSTSTGADGSTARSG